MVQEVLTRWNGPLHRRALLVFLAIVIAHWAEHLVQGFQVYVLGMARPESRGVLGQWIPWLATSEWLHYGYAIVMLAGLFLLRPGMQGRARLAWDVALWIQVWHHFEHVLLLGQAWTGIMLFAQAAPTSVVQLVIPRVELHLLYNGLVTVPMVVAMVLHVRGPSVGCTCGAGHASRHEPSAAA